MLVQNEKTFHHNGRSSTKKSNPSSKMKTEKLACARRARNGDHATTAARIEVLSGFQTRRGGAGREEGGGGGAGEGASSEATGAPPRLRVARGRWVVPEAEVDEDGGKKLELCVARCWRGRSPWGRGGRTFPHMKNRGRHEPLLDRSKTDSSAGRFGKPTLSSNVVKQSSLGARAGVYALLVESW
jgi:hypothetical protein